MWRARYRWSIAVTERPAETDTPVHVEGAIHHREEHVIQGLHDQFGILVGPSPIGFADPAHGACISLFQVTVCVLNYRIDTRNAMTLNALSKMLHKVGETFLDGLPTHYVLDGGFSASLL